MTRGEDIGPIAIDAVEPEGDAGDDEKSADNVDVTEEVFDTVDSDTIGVKVLPNPMRPSTSKVEALRYRNCCPVCV